MRDVPLKLPWKSWQRFAIQRSTLPPKTHYQYIGILRSTFLGHFHRNLHTGIAGSANQQSSALRSWDRCLRRTRDRRVRRRRVVRLTSESRWSVSSIGPQSHGSYHLLAHKLNSFHYNGLVSLAGVTFRKTHQVRAIFEQ